MLQRTFALVVIVLTVALLGSSAWAQDTKPGPRGRIPVVFATDIGSDVDDTWALAMLLRSPELDLKMVLTETGEAHFRALVAAKFLESVGRADVAVALGLTAGPMSDEQRHQGPWVKDYDLKKYPGRVHDDGVAALLELVNKTTAPLTVIAVGPVPTLAAAVKRDPEFARRCRLIGMFGSFDIGYGGADKPAAEWNVVADVPALRTVLAAPWREILITPLDTCGTVSLRDENYRAVWQAAPTDPFARAVIENYCIWAPRVPWIKCDFFTTRSSTLFDNVAVYLAYAEQFVDIESVRFRLTDDGFTVRDHAGPFQARVALRWRNQTAFEKHLTNRILGRAP